MGWLLDPFAPAFMQRALLAALLAVVTTSLVGTWVVVRGLAFMGDALAHGVLPGLALAYLVGFDLTLGACLGAVVMVAGVSLVHRSGDLAEDTGIGLLFAGMLALGVILVSRAGSFSVDLTAFLFGDVLGVDGNDVALAAAAAAVTAVGTLALYRGLLVLSFHPSKAALLGLHPGLCHAAMLTLLAVAVVASFRTVGTMLVFGLLVAPPASASLLVRRMPAMMAVSILYGSFAAVAGLVISYHADTAAGATISATAVASFFLTLAARRAHDRIRAERGRAGPTPTAAVT